MEKILLELLKVKLPNVDSEAVLELCNVCPDPVVAVETITGLYKEPAINEEPHQRFVDHYDDYENIEVLNYDKWDNTVKIQYNVHEHEYIFMHNDDTYEPTWEEKDNYEPQTWQWSSTKLAKDGELEKDYKIVKILGPISKEIKTKSVNLNYWNIGDSSIK